MALSRTLTAAAGFGALALVAGSAALHAAFSPSEPSVWSAAAAAPEQVHLVSDGSATAAAGSTTVVGTPPAVTAAGAAGTATTSAAAAAATTATATTAALVVTSGAPGTAATPVATVATEESPEHERCEAALPAVVIGDPGTRAGAESGYRIWHDGSGWHLRTTHPGEDAVLFTGVIRSGQPITATGYRFEKGDRLTLSADRRTLTFALVNHGGLDGVDFTDRCAIHTTFTLLRGGHQVSSSAIHLGAHDGHPTSNPFLVERRRH